MNLRKNKYYDALYEEGLKDEEEEIPEENLLPESYANDRTDVKKTVLLVLILMGCFTFVEAVLIFVLPFPVFFERICGRGGLFFGLLIGLILGAVWFLTMEYQLRGILGGAPSPKAKLKIGAILRILLVIGVLVLAYFTRWFSPITVLIGVLNLKFAAFLAGMLKGWKFGKK